MSGRRAVTLVVLAGCGRIGFDALGLSGDGDGGPDGAADAVRMDGAVAVADAPPSPDARPCMQVDGFCPPACAADPDCATICGDGVCVGNAGETCGTCPDCVTQAAVCGNGLCDAGEFDTTCAGDCGPNPWPDAWVVREQELIDGVNAHRAAGTDCPTGAQAPAPPLVRDDPLTRAARRWAYENAAGDYEVQLGLTCNGTTDDQLAADEGATYSGSIHLGLSGADSAQIVELLIDGDTTCGILMNPTYTLIGIGHAERAFPWWNSFYR